MAKTLTKKAPPSKQAQNLQFDLFTQFVSNDSSVSNAIEAWESIPKYFTTAHQAKRLRTATGHADPVQWEYIYNDQNYKVKIQPALVEQKDGSYQACFPGVTEELVEEALKKILSDQVNGYHDPKEAESWVRFSLSMLLKELTAQGRSRNRAEIKHAIEVMSSCILTVYRDGQEAYKGPILADLVTVNRSEYIDDPKAYHVARLPAFISHSINQLQYRQFNYERLMHCNNQLARWLYKLLINRFTQADYSNDYHFMYSKVVKNSGLLQQGTMQRNREKIKAAFEDLIKNDVIHEYTEDPRKDGRKIVDIKYNVRASIHFVGEQKAANKRKTDARVTASKAGLISK